MESAPPTDAPPRRTERRLARWLVLAAALAAGFALRVAYGWPDPGPGRNWDDRFGLPNVESILRAGAFRPVNAFHPSLSYLPQTLALAAVDACRCLELGTGTDSVLRRSPRARRKPVGGGPAISAISPLGYRSCRIFQSLLGIAALLLLYRLAAAVVSRWSAVALAATLGFVPWHLWMAGLCNEETGLFVAIELAALATLYAVRRRDLAGAALAGAALGVALATKLNGGLAALPFALWSLADARRDRRALVRLAAAGLVAAITFFALNPHFLTRFEMVRRDFGFTVGHYGREAALDQTGRLHVLASGLASPASAEYLGVALALLAAAGLVVAWLPASRSSLDPERRARLRLLSLFPLTYVPAFALVTPHVKGHNWLPVLPFALVLAGAGVEALVALARRAGGARLAAAAIALALAAALPVAARGVAFVYGATVPTTAEVALYRLGSELPTPALVARVRPHDRAFVGRDAPRRRWLEIEISGRRAGLDRARLDLLDAWVLDRLRAEALGVAASAERVPPRLGRARGPELFVGLHPWRRADRRAAGVAVARSGSRLEARIGFPTRGAAPTHRSLRFGWIGQGRLRRCQLTLPDGAAVPLHLDRRRKRRPPAGQVALHVAPEVFFSERFPASAASATLTCTVTGEGRLAEPFEVLDWRPGRR